MPIYASVIDLLWRARGRLGSPRRCRSPHTRWAKFAFRIKGSADLRGQPVEQARDVSG